MMSSIQNLSVQGIGIDLENNERIMRLIEKWGVSFMERVYTPAEIAYCLPKKDNGGSFTARFAAKEALLKALGTGLRDGFKWKEMEVLNDTQGKPYFTVYGKVKRVLQSRKVYISLSHTAQQAVAVVIIGAEDPN